MRFAASVYLLLAGSATAVHAEPPAGPMDVRVAVVSQDDGSVAEIDTDSIGVVATVKVGKGPAGIAVSPDARSMYLTHPDGKAIGIIDAASGALLRALPFDGEPFGIAAGQGVIYVSDWSKDRVTRIDLGPGDSSTSVAVGKSPAGLALDGARHRLYVANRESGGITVVDAATMQAVTSIATGTAPYALALSPDNRLLYVANVRSNDLAVIDTVRLERVATIAVGSMPYGVSVTQDGALVVVTNQHGNSLAVVDAHARKLVATVPVGRYPEGVLAGPNGLVYVANWFSGDVSVIDLAQRKEIRRIKVGDGPRSFALLPVHARSSR